MRRRKTIVRETFVRIAPIADQAGAMLYDKMFALDPDLRRLFKIDIPTQGAKIMAVFATAIANLHRLDEILPSGARARPPARRVRRQGYGL